MEINNNFNLKIKNVNIKVRKVMYKNKREDALFSI